MLSLGPDEMKSMNSQKQDFCVCVEMKATVLMFLQECMCAFLSHFVQAVKCQMSVLALVCGLFL